MTDQAQAPGRLRAPARPISRALPSAALAAAILFSPTIAAACACGCGIFDVGGASGIMPNYGEGDYTIYFRYDYMNQNQNWEGSNKAPAADNGDKEINTSFYTEGFQWRINSQWSLMVELPVYARHLTTTDDGTVQGPPGSVYTGKLTDLGDLAVMANYTGLTPDGTTGIIAGLKLPTGNYTGPTGPLGGAEFDRDSLPGTGSTDAILGAYHNGALSADGRLGYYAQIRGQAAFLTRDGYRPGNEYDAAAGVDYSFAPAGPFRSITPVLSFLASYRERDSESQADPNNSGYFRALIAPGVEFHVASFRLYADIEKPLYQHTNAGTVAADGTAGQLIASTLYKVQLNYDF